MPSPVELYPLVALWLQALGLPPQRTALASLAELVTAVLAHQSLRSSALMRALLSPLSVPAAQRYRRVRRAWTRPWLTSAWLTPCLVRAVLAVLAPPAGWPVHLALDSVRCGPWEVFTVGVVWRGRALPVGWAVLPYPWPKGQFTPTVCALVRQVALGWPVAVPVQLVADRAFPSRAFFQTLRTVGWGWTVRLQARHAVTVGGQPQAARTLLATAREGAWTVAAGTFGRGPHAVPGHLVVGRGLVVLPAHQRTAGSLRARAQQRTRRQQHVATKHPGRAPAAAPRTDAWLVLFTSHPGPPSSCRRAATGSYRLRWSIEGSYRDAQGGWDGQHGWDLEAVLRRLRDGARVERTVGLWALGTLLQTAIGHQLGQPGVPPVVQAVVAQWTTTGRLSVWARGQFALQDRSGQLRPWLTATLTAGAQRVAAAPPPTPQPQAPLVRAPRGPVAPELRPAA